MYYANLHFIPSASDGNSALKAQRRAAIRFKGQLNAYSDKLAFFRDYPTPFVSDWRTMNDKTSVDVRQQDISFSFKILNGAINGAAKMGARFGKQWELNQMLREAQQKTGFSNFGDEYFRTPFSMLVESIADEFDELSAVGKMRLRGILMGGLVNRLILESKFDESPQLSDAPVEKPLMIISLPRTGTTFFHRLLCRDPAGRPLLFWESAQPVLHPKQQSKKTDPRVRRARRINWLARCFSPKTSQMHHLDALGPEECNLLLRNTYMLPHPALVLDKFSQWYMNAPQKYFDCAYVDYRRQLQALQENHLTQDRHWILKAPAHMFGLASLIRALPNASIVQIHRDPRASVGSMASLGLHSYAMLSKSVSKRTDLPRRLVDWLAESLRRFTDARSQISSDRVFDISYEDLLADPIGKARDVYDHFGYKFTDGFQESAKQWLADNPQHKFGKHEYRLEDFGLTDEMVSAAFQGYDHRNVIERSIAK